MRRLVVFCDESVQDGPYYSNFFGAAMVEEKNLKRVNDQLTAKLTSLNLGGEVKFSKISSNYQTKYQELMIEFFQHIKAGDVKIRLLFTQNDKIPVLTPEQKKKNRYFLLYYQLIKHGFGWQHMTEEGPVKLLLNFDVFPQTKADIVEFRQYLCGLSHLPEFTAKGILVTEDNIAEVHSHSHVILQCLDIIMGSVQCKLNEGHKHKTPGSRFISKRAKAKEAVYKTIRNEILKLYPGYNFNVGETTAYRATDGTDDYHQKRWSLPYRQWKFEPASAEPNTSYNPKNK